MLLPNGETLMHDRAPYDPAKAKEYYERTKKLKGRKPGAGPPPPKGKSRGSAMITIKRPDGKILKLTPQQHREQKAIAAKRVQSIKKKLSKLQGELKERMKKAKDAERESKKPDSTAEKAEKARDSEKYRDKNQQKIKSAAKKADAKKSDSKSGTDSVEGLKSSIASVQKSLKAAVARQRMLG